MLRRQAARVAGVVALVALGAAGASWAQRSRQQEAAEHPRIAAAIAAINDAVAYMQAAPHDFGGHKAAAIEASRAAVTQLRLALAYRAGADQHKKAN